MGALGDSASLSYSSASGEARNSTRQSSGFSAVKPVGMGHLEDSSVVMSVVSAVFGDEGIERVGISASAIESSGQNPLIFQRYANIAEGLTEPLGAEEEVVGEIAQAALMTQDRVIVFGMLERVANGDFTSEPFVAEFDVTGYRLRPADEAVIPERVQVLTELQAHSEDREWEFRKAVETQAGVFAVLVNVDGNNGARSEVWTMGQNQETTLLWSSSDISQDARFRGLQGDRAGGLLLAGTLEGRPVVVRLGAPGAGWVQDLSDVGDEIGPATILEPNDVAEIADGMVLVVGNLTIPGEGNAEDRQIVSMTQLDRLTGTPMWSRNYQEANEPGEFVTGNAVAADGATGSYWVGGETNFAHSPIRSYGGQTDHYVHRFDAQGREWGYRGVYCEAWLEDLGLGAPDAPIQ